MKLFKGKTLTLLSTFLTISSASAIPHFQWDNQDGVTVQENCSIERTRNNDYRVSRYVGRGSKPTENLRNSNGVLQSHLINSSLVKLISGKEKRDYKKIEVVGINTNTSMSTNRWSSERGDQGYLYHESMLPLEDFVIELDLAQNDLREKFDIDIFKSSVENVDLTKKLYLRIAADSSYYKLNCDDESEREYLIFRGYQKENSESPLFLMGISTQETSLLKSFAAIQKTTAMTYLSDVGNEEALVEGEIQSNVMVVTAEEEKSIQEELDVASSARPQQRPESLNKVTSSLEKLVCIGTKSLNVRDQSLDEVLFKASLGEKIKVFQGWDEETVVKTINGTEYTFNKVEFPNREEKDERIGYVASSFVKTEADCRFIEEGKPVRNAQTQITGLDDSRCCDFPTVKKPTHSFTSGMRRFRAGRSGGRLHAACDLYRYKNEAIKSVAPGKVISNLYRFYQGTYAIEIRHSGGFVVRYGELTGKRVPGVRKNSNVNMGQKIGYMGKVNSNCCRPMLHFELYSGSRTGSLSKSSGRYRRRNDLLDPTPYLNKWQDEVF